jgi:GT2 family glycosyltransferase
MTYRTQKIGLNRFSIELENGPSGGYALGEDVDFSIRIGKLGLIENLCIEHKQAPSVRDSSRVMSRAIGRWHGYLIRNHPEKVSFFRTITLDIFLLGYLFLKVIMFRENASNEFVNKYIELESLMRELRNPILIRKKQSGL